MDAAEADKTQVPLRHTLVGQILAGLEAGIVGALLMIVWSMAGSLWSRRSIWAIPNLYSTMFYGSRVYNNHLARNSWTGIALILAVCGLGGIAWGLLGSLLWRTGRKPFLALFGAMAGLFLYYTLFSGILLHAAPLVALYAPEPETQIGYVIWGLALARSPGYAEAIR